MHDYFAPWYGPSASLLPFLTILPILMLWSIAIKGYALWHAARDRQMWWFVALLVVNSVGILELVYLIWFSPSKPLGTKHPASKHTSHHAHPEVSSEPQE